MAPTSVPIASARHRAFRFRFPAVAGLCLLLALPAAAQRQAEPLGRGMVAVRNSSTVVHVGWRLLAGDPAGVTFNLYRSADGGAPVKLNAQPLATTTDYTDTPPNLSTTAYRYHVRAVTGGVEGPASAAATLPANATIGRYLTVPIQAPPGAAPPYDVKFCWVGDLDGDGEYDFVVDRHSTTSSTDHQYLEGYLRDGTFLWRVDMGPNSVDKYSIEPGSSAISVGAHDNVTVYDMDGDGKAEVLVRTANGVVLGDGATVTAADETTQFISMLDGMTGAERSRAPLPNPYLVDGPLAGHMAIQYCDGRTPSLVFEAENRVGSGGFNMIVSTWGWDASARSLALRWSWQRGSTPASDFHQIRIADVDNDGKDEFVEGGFTLDDDGTLLFDTELSHGDRFQTADIDPQRPGLETFAIQQDNPTLLTTALYEAGTGRMIRRWYAPNVVDVGRGDAVDLDPRHLGVELYSTQPGMFNARGERIGDNKPWPSLGIWWDGDLRREFMTGAGSTQMPPVIDKWDYLNASSFRLYTIYSEGVHQPYAGRPPFFGDILGDWREEIVLVANDYNSLRVYTTNSAATNRLYCVMQNPAYRMQTTAKGYVQAPYPDFYLGEGMSPPPPPPVVPADLVWTGTAGPAWDAGVTANWSAAGAASVFQDGRSVLFDLGGANAMPVTLAGVLRPAAVTVHAPCAYVFSGAGSLGGAMTLVKAGAGLLQLDGAHTFTGRTTVWDGDLRVNGSLASPVTVHGGTWGGVAAAGTTGGRVSGTGTLAAGVVVADGGAIVPGTGGTAAGTLTVAGSLACAGSAVMVFDLAATPAGASDLVQVNGNLTLSGSNTFILRGTPAPGTYTLVRYTGALGGGLANLVVEAPAGLAVTLANPAGSIQAVVAATRSPATVVWSGQNGTAWDLNTTANWTRGGAADVFVTGDTVRFDHTATAPGTVQLTNTMLPAATTVEGAADYQITGPGGIGGGGGLAKSGTGRLTMLAANRYTGPTTVGGGTLEVADLSEADEPGPLGAAAAAATHFVLEGGATFRLTGENAHTNRGLTLGTGGATVEVTSASGSAVLAGEVTGAGNLVKTGPGALILTHANTYSGGTLIKEGRVQLGTFEGNNEGVGSGDVTLDGGTLSMADLQIYNNPSWNLIVPAGSSGRLNADGRCSLNGSLTGGGTFTFYTAYVRTNLNGNWSQFTGRILAITDSDGGEFRVNNTYGYANAALDLGDKVRACFVPTVSSGGATVAIGELTGSASSTLVGGPTAGRTLTWRIGARNTDATFAGTVGEQSDSTITALTKTGTGLLDLTGTCNHRGPTTVAAGTLRVSGATTASSVTVQGGAALGGTGSITGNVTAAGGAILDLLASPLAITGTLAMSADLVVRATADPGPGTHVVATFTSSTGVPACVWQGPPGTNYLARFTLEPTQLSVTLIDPTVDTDGDLITDVWELTFYASVETAGPLDDTDGDGFNTWLEWKAGTSPVNAGSRPDGSMLQLTTADGDGFDGSLCEVNYSAAYDGGFYTNDTSKYRNNTYQNPGLRHYLTVLKFDLTSLRHTTVAGGSLQLTINGSTGSAKTRTLAAFAGDDALITPDLRYDAANPFLDDAYVGETDTDTDFATGTVIPILDFANTLGGTVQTIGSGNEVLAGVLQSALDDDGVVTLLVYGGASQFLTQADEDPDPARRPTLNLAMPATPDPDTDADGLDDAWEAHYFGTLARGGNDDSDADGTPEWLEFRLGLDPTNAASAFALSIVRTGNDLTLTWPDAAGLTFTVESSPSLLPGSWAVAATLAGIGSPGTLSFPVVATDMREFFRVRATLP